MFPRIAIHTGNRVVATNRHPRWEGTIVLQHNGTTCTILKHGPSMTNAAKLRHPILSTYQGNCTGAHWHPYESTEENHLSHLFGQIVTDGEIPTVVSANRTEGIGVAPAVAH